MLKIYNFTVTDDFQAKVNQILFNKAQKLSYGQKFFIIVKQQDKFFKVEATVIDGISSNDFFNSSSISITKNELLDIFIKEQSLLEKKYSEKRQKIENEIFKINN